MKMPAVYRIGGSNACGFRQSFTQSRP